jgi:hypothetical protein
MRKGSLTWPGFLLRLLFALALVYASYNPEGYSYYHWVRAGLDHPEAGLPGSGALKFLAGIVLLSGWVVYANATRNSLGMFGVALILALCGGVVWWFAEMRLFNPGDVQSAVHLAEITVGIVLALGMSWSHIYRRLSGQVDVEDGDD